MKVKHDMDYRVTASSSKQCIYEITYISNSDIYIIYNTL